MKAFVFPGQGAQYVGMGNDLPDNDIVHQHLQLANEILGFDLKVIMTDGSLEELKQTHVTQPALYVHSLIRLNSSDVNQSDIEAVAGHSLGEFTALAAAKVFDFETGLSLVKTRSQAMKEACDRTEGTMAAVLGLDDLQIEEICSSLESVVVAANYNSPGQVVISGSVQGVEEASVKCSEAGARRVVPLVVGGAFHSPLMEPARQALAAKIEEITFQEPYCKVYQNVRGTAVSDPAELKSNLISQLTSPVKWSQTMQNMKADGLTSVTEVGGNGKVLTGLFKRIDRTLEMRSI